MSAVSSLSQDVGKKSACEALTVPRAIFYRHVSPESLLWSKSPVLFLFWP